MSNEIEKPVTIKEEKPKITSESKTVYWRKYSFSDYKLLENIVIFL